jgi:hypothetical protein
MSRYRSILFIFAMMRYEFHRILIPTFTADTHHASSFIFLANFIQPSRAVLDFHAGNARRHFDATDALALFSPVVDRRTPPHGSPETRSTRIIGLTPNAFIRGFTRAASKSFRRHHRVIIPAIFR